VSPRIALVAIAIAVIGCSDPSINDICEELAEDCEDIFLDDCKEDGKLLEDDAAAKGCSDLLQDYVVCVDEESCSWRNSCADERAELAACVGQTP
jgi:hypothetical protein